MSEMGWTIALKVAQHSSSFSLESFSLGQNDDFMISIGGSNGTRTVYLG